MSNQNRAVFMVALMVLSVLSTGVVGLTGTSSTDTVELTGELTFDDGTNVDGWKVMADGDETHYTNITSNGSFGFDVAKNDTYNLKYEQFNPNYSSEQNWPRDGKPDLWAIDTVSVGSSATVAGSYELPPAHLLTVTVVDQNGDPVENAEVFIVHKRNDARASNDATTDIDGRMVMVGNDQPGIEVNGSIQLHVRGPAGYGDNFTSLTVHQNRSVTITVKEKVTANGTVEYANGSASANDHVGLHGQDGDGDRTNSNGSYSLSIVPNNTYEWVFFQGSPHTPAPADGVPDFNYFGPVNITSNTTLATQTLPQGNNLTVVVERSDGTAVENASVSIGLQIDDRWAGTSRQTNASGMSSIEVNGTFGVYVVPPDGSNLTRNGTQVTVSEDKTVRIRLKEKATVTGRIFEPNGSAAAGDRVRLHGLSGDGTVTSTDGMFSLNVSKGSEYDWVYFQDDSDFQAPNDNIPDFYPFEAVSIAGDTRLPNKTLPKGHDLTVTVERPDGTPVEGASVNFNQQRNDAWAGLERQTDSDGVVTIDANGTININVRPPEGSQLSREFQEVTVDQNRSVTIVLKPTVNVTGRVETAGGTAAAGWIARVDGRESGARGFGTEIQADGSFAGKATQNDSFALVFQQEQFSNDHNYPKDGIPDVHPLTEFQTGTADVDLATHQLPEGHLVNITVVNESGAPISDVEAFISVTNNSVRGWTHGRTNSDGEVVLDGASSTGVEVNGDVHVHIQADDVPYADGEARFTVDSNRSVTITLERAMNVTGTIQEPDGDPATNERVSAHRMDADGGGDTTWTNSNGNFTARVAESGTYSVGFVQVPNAGDHQGTFPRDGVPDLYAVGTADNASRELGTVQLPKPHNVTVIVENQNGTRLSDVQVHIAHHNGEARAGENTRTDGNGTINAELLGEIDIHVDPGSDSPYLENGTSVTVSSDQTIRIVLKESTHVTGHLEDASGSAVVGYHVEAFGQGGSHSLTNASGGFDIKVVPDQTYDLAFKQTDWGGGKTNFPKDGRTDLYAFEPVSVGQTPVDVGTYTLPRGHLVNVTVVNESGSPIEGVEVGVVPINGDASGHHPGITNSQGEVILRDATSPGIELNGTVRFRVSATGEYLGNTTTIDVHSRRNVTIVLEEGATISGRMEDESGTGLAGDFVIADADVDEDTFKVRRTNETGNFSIPVPQDNTYSVGYVQWNESTGEALPRDGVTDLYEADIVSVQNDDVDIGTKTVPNASGILNIRVVDTTGEPVENAEIGIDPDQQGAVRGVIFLGSSSDQGYYVVDGKRGLEANGSYIIEVTPPDKIGFNSSRTYVRNVTVTNDTTVVVEVERQAISVTGTLNESSGSAAANDTVVLFGDGPDSDLGVIDGTITDDQGRFALTAYANRSQDLQYYQVNDTTSELNIDPAGSAFPKDDSPDVFALARVNSSTDVSLNTTLPTAYVLNVSVVDENGNPIENATVGIRHHNGEADAGIVGITTNADGLMELGSGRNESHWPGPGVEVVGNVTVTVRPPENATRFEDKSYTRNLTVQNDTLIEVTLKNETAETLVVGPDQNYTSIQAAVDAADDGDTIQVKARQGGYNETVVVNKTLDIVGDPGDASWGPNSTAPVVDGGLERRKAFVLESGAAGTSLIGFEVRNYTGAGIIVKADDVTVTDNNVHDIRGQDWPQAIVSPTPDVVETGIFVRNNVISDVGFSGIHLMSVSDSSIANNSISGAANVGSTLSNDTATGIIVQARAKSSPTFVENVSVSDNVLHGPFEYSGINLFAINETAGNHADIARTEVTDNVVTGATNGVNIVTRHSETSVGDITIWRNDLSNNEQGVNLQFAPNSSNGYISIVGNDIYDNGDGVMIGEHADANLVEVHVNSLLNNSGAGINNTAPYAVDARHNWFGNVSGPHPIGTGDAIFGEIEFEPWLVRPADPMWLQGRVLNSSGQAATGRVKTISLESATRGMTGGTVRLQSYNDGQFTFLRPTDHRTAVVYEQTQNGKLSPAFDGEVDAHLLTTVNASSNVDTGENTLPQGHELNITVVDQNDNPIENATVTILLNDPANGTVGVFTGGKNLTGPAGQFWKANADRPGIELAGNVSVIVTPPPNSSEFDYQLVSDTFTLNNSTEKTFTLQRNTSGDSTATETATTTVTETATTTAATSTVDTPGGPDSDGLRVTSPGFGINVALVVLLLVGLLARRGTKRDE